MYTINLQTPLFLTDSNGNSLALIPADEYRELLALVEMYEELEDIRSVREAKGEKTEPIDIFFERVEKYRKENRIS